VASVAVTTSTLIPAKTLPRQHTTAQLAGRPDT